MSKLTPYINEIVSFIVMLLMVIALVACEVNARAYQLAAHHAASDEVVGVSHFRLEDE